MALITSQEILVTGLTATYSAVTASDTLAVDPNNVLLVYHVKNGGGSTDTVTVIVPGNTPFLQANPDVAITVLAGAERFIFLRHQGLLVDPFSSLVTITHSFITSVTAALLKVAL